MSAATVYAFLIWDHNKGENVQGPRSATREAIQRIRGEAIETTAKTVDESELDGNGFYPRRLPLTHRDADKLRAFQRAVDTNGANPLSRQELDWFIAAGLLESRGVAVRCTAVGELALSK
jgi:hypothetical protein